MKKNRIIPTNILIIVGIAVSSLLSLGLILTSFSGYLNPIKYSKFAVLGMTFPFFLFGVLAMLLVWLISKQWIYFLLFLVPVLICGNAIYTYCPLNLFHSKLSEEQKDSKFSLLTYNVMNFDDFEDRKLDYNPTISFILKTDADMVCLQECYDFNPNKEYNITQSQVDSLYAKYPYRLNNKRDLGFLSKYPIDSVESISNISPEFSCAMYKVKLKNDTVSIFNVHLKSIGLTVTDKELYMKITSVKDAGSNIDHVKEKIKDIKGQLYSKLAMAFRERARQAEFLKPYLENQQGVTILCGDFNDTPNSFAYREIKGDMKDAYRECGFGPSITYHANRFYFRIDQVFYKGNIKAVDAKRIKVGHSDHYPILTEFIKEY